MIMSLITEIVPYIQGNGLVATTIVNPPGTLRTCDNGVMFSSEYFIMAARNFEDKTLTHGPTAALFDQVVKTCVGADKELHRAPGDDSPDEVDDHYATLAGYAEFGLRPAYKLPVRLWRQPQLLYAYLVNHKIPSLLIWPLAWYNALIIATSCIGHPASDTDSRRLVWHLIQATKRESILARLAGAFWHWRQTKIYKTQEVMKAVAKIYYEPGHPFAKYWID